MGETGRAEKSKDDVIWKTACLLLFHSFSLYIPSNHVVIEAQSTLNSLTSSSRMRFSIPKHWVSHILVLTRWKEIMCDTVLDHNQFITADQSSKTLLQGYFYLPKMWLLTVMAVSADPLSWCGIWMKHHDGADLKLEQHYGWFIVWYSGGSERN